MSLLSYTHRELTKKCRLICYQQMSDADKSLSVTSYKNIWTEGDKKAGLLNHTHLL